MEDTQSLQDAILSNLSKLKPVPQNQIENETITEAPNFNQIQRSTFDFESQRAYFDQVYFKSSKLFKISSKEHTDFWSFVKKYQALMKRRQALNTNTFDTSKTSFSPILNLPIHYDRRYHINFVYKPRKETFAAYDWQGRAVQTTVTDAQAAEFELIIHLYMDFCQKEKFQKLQKLREAQAGLPVFKYRQDILDVVKANQITIIAGDTGCGKSTQIPRYLLEAGYDKIGCTQPRRIACMSLAKRVGYETLNEFRTEVAYQVRFEKTRTRHTKILFLTEGVLLRQIQTDPILSQYNIIVVDEVHERHVFTDFLLGILKCLAQQRPDLKIILMSATINIHLFSSYFTDCVVVKIPGRTYKIDVEYVPVLKDKDPKSRNSNKIDPGPYIRLMQQIDKKYPEDERGDMLIFLSGLSDIQTVCDAAKEYALQTKKWIVLPLHSTLSMEDQEKVFDIAPFGVRKCILSTNIAETSITIDGLRFIIDSGKVKEISYDSKYKMSRLQEFWISRASAEQRKGRAGRTGPGVCFRIYTEADYTEFKEFTTPEIRRVPLNSLLLQMVAMGLKDVRKFPFIEPPDEQSIENSLLFLIEQNALDEKEQLTPMGRMLADLPVDIQIGKMLIMGSIFHVIEPVVIMSAALSVQSPFLSNLRCDAETMNSRKEIVSDHGDPLTLLNAFNEWIKVKTSHSVSSGKWARKRGLEEQRFYEISKLRRQFDDLLKENSLAERKESSGSESEGGGGGRRESYADKQRKDYEKILAKKERKRLLDMKKDIRMKPKKAKVLTLDDVEVDTTNLDIDGTEEECSDIRDIDFKLMHNLNELQNKSLSCQKFTLGDLNLLKIILVRGLYPQVAIADDFNNYKRDSDQCFHTKHKPFVVLHPTSVFAYDPDILQPCDDGLVKGKLKFSTRHQLLLYVSLFETNKAYLMNCMRIPALQSLLLYGRSLDTNADCTRIICDDWLEICFLDQTSAQTIVSAVLSLRTSIDKLFKIRLESRKSHPAIDDLDLEEEEETPRQDQATDLYERRRKTRKLEKLLKKKLTEFLDSSVLYSLRRVLPAELKTVYVKQFEISVDQKSDELGASEFLKNVSTKIRKEKCQVNELKGGFRVTDYLNYGCLVSDATIAITSEYGGSLAMQRHWKCGHCGGEFVFNLKDRMEHEVTCQMNNEAYRAELAEDSTTAKSKKPVLNGVDYFCPVCKTTFNLSSIDILKHKRSHL